MNIGDRYSETKLYRGIKNSNELPLIAEDLHEFSDTLINKSSYLLNSILGSGLIKDLNISVSSEGLSLLEPAILHIDGDICLIKNSASKYLASMSELYDNSLRTGTILVVGWYQHLHATSVMREYGGVTNDVLENNLMYEPLDIQVSTRYQFRWDIGVLHGEENLGALSIKARDVNGDEIPGEYKFSNIESKDSIYTADAPAGMDYCVDGKVYIIPLIDYETSTESREIAGARNVAIRKTSTKVEFIEQRFIDVASTDINSPSDIDIQMDFSSIPEDGVLQVSYEGLELLEGIDYVFNRSSRVITLLGFTRKAGENLVVTLTYLRST